jgi:hypothetical protein
VVFGSWNAYLRVTDENDLGAGALLVVGGDGLNNSGGALGCRGIVGNASAGRSSTASRVHDGLRASAGEGRLD